MFQFWRGISPKCFADQKNGFGNSLEDTGQMDREFLDSESSLDFIFEFPVMILDGSGAPSGYFSMFKILKCCACLNKRCH